MNNQQNVQSETDAGYGADLCYTGLFSALLDF